MDTSCEHLNGLTASDFPPPRTPFACEECLIENTQWVALRECRTGPVVTSGAATPRPRRHATRHFHETKHPVMRSVMPNDSWDWCYVHEASDDLGASYSPP
jgi:CPA1 family monovalent cation:H+ antiporter